jgi:hypothetical protein
MVWLVRLRVRLVYIASVISCCRYIEAVPDTVSDSLVYDGESTLKRD